MIELTLDPPEWQFDRRPAARHQHRLASAGRAARVDRWATEGEPASIGAQVRQSTSSEKPRPSLPICTDHPPEVSRRDVPAEYLNAARQASTIATTGLGLLAVPVCWYGAAPGSADDLGFTCPCSPMVVHVRADHPHGVVGVVTTTFHEVRHAAQFRLLGLIGDQAEHDRREDEARAYGREMARQYFELGPDRLLRRVRERAG